jgi:glucokinase
VEWLSATLLSAEKALSGKGLLLVMRTAGPSREEVNAMRVLVSKKELNEQEATEAAARRSARMPLILSFSILGMAVAYFSALYLIAR